VLLDKNIVLELTEKDKVALRFCCLPILLSNYIFYSVIFIIFYKL